MTDNPTPDLADCPMCDGEAARFTPASGRFCIACGQDGRVPVGAVRYLAAARIHVDGDARTIASLRRPKEAADQMTLRDWFAGHALAGLCANPELLKQMPAVIEATRSVGDIDDVVAQLAGNYADAMIAARKENPHAQG